MGSGINRRTDSGDANVAAAGFHDELFRPLPGREWNWRSVTASVVIHGFVLALVICVPLVLHREMPVMDVVFLAPVPPRLLAPRVPPPKPPEMQQRKLISPATVPPPVAPPVPEPVRRVELPRRDPDPEKQLKPGVLPPPPLPEPPGPQRAELPKPEVKTNVFDSAAAASAPKRSGEVKTGEFGDDKPQSATARPAREVQTGGFGSPTDNTADPSPAGKARRPTLGSFDLPQGPGTGDGTGGSRGARGGRGVVASAGFGETVADSGNGSGRGGTVQSGGFADMGTAAVTTGPLKAKTEEPDLKPVEIISKPKPVYTTQARELRLEGEVQVEVVFTAAGAVRVLRVARGLGHGLDEAAVKAAEQIRFKPAQRAGRAVDFKATVNIIFRLA
jgi:TonB family protein